MNARYAARLLLVPLLVLTAWLAWWPDSHPPDTPDSQGKGESLLVWQIKPTAAGPQSGDFPRAGLPDGAVAALRPGERIDPDASMLTLPLPGRKPISLPVAGRFDHPNGDFTLHARGRASNLSGQRSPLATAEFMHASQRPPASTRSPRTPMAHG